MRICVIVGTEKKLHRGFEIKEVGSVGAVKVRKLVFERRRARRALRRAMRKVRTEDNCFAAEDGFLYYDEFLLKSGTNLPLIRRLEEVKLADMALLFAETLGYEAGLTRFIFRTGSAAAIYNAARKIGEHTRHIVLNCVSQEYIAERLFLETGAVARLLSEVGENRGCEIEIFFSEEGGAILRAGGSEAHFSDFCLLLPEKYREIIPQECTLQAAAILFSYGFIHRDDMKIIPKKAQNKN